MEENKGKWMAVLSGPTIRDIVRRVNDKSINKDDIVTLIKDNGQFILVYYEN